MYKINDIKKVLFDNQLIIQENDKEENELKITLIKRLFSYYDKNQKQEQLENLQKIFNLYVKCEQQNNNVCKVFVNMPKEVEEALMTQFINIQYEKLAVLDDIKSN